MLVITDQGEKLGVLTRGKALQEADDRGLDLVLVSPDANPPVAKLMDYSKFRFQQQKKLKEMKKNKRLLLYRKFSFHLLLRSMTSKLRLRRQEQSLKREIR